MRETTPALVLLVSPHRTPDDRFTYDQLRAAGLSIWRACDVASAMRWLRDECVDLLVLAPDAGGDDERADTLARVKGGGFLGMILVVGRHGHPSAAAAALDCGADDYVPLSRDPSELLARVRALVRRGGSGGPALEREVAGVVLDLRRGVVRSNGVEVTLTRREADLFEYLARHAGQPVSREELATRIWRAAPPSDGGTNIVDVYVSYLRRKLATLGRQSLIRSVRGVGYELVESRDVMTHV